MKNSIFIIGLIGSLLIASCSEPNAEDILRKSYEKCQLIENGYYEMQRYMKYMSNKDTFSTSYNCYFRKLTDDSIYSSAFHYQRYYDGEYSMDVMYTGDEFVNYSNNDSTGQIMSKTLWAKEIKRYSHNYTFYSPLTNKKSHPLPNDSDFVDSKHRYDFIGKEMINNILCYHIRENIVPENDSTEMMRTIRTEKNYWISKQDYIPVQYSIAFDVVMNNDTMYQYERNVLTKYELNNLKDEEQLKLSSIPEYVNLKDFTPSKSPKLLPKDTIAPQWSLVSLSNDTIDLNGLRGQLVLIDFFYKACYPCMLALPGLQDLHERYEGKGLEIIGINPYDTIEKDDIDNFLAKRGVTFTVLLGGLDVAKEYRVSAYPTVYLIDKEGNVLSTHVGYGEGSVEHLEEIIKENL